MKATLKQVVRSPRFMIGFCTVFFIILFINIYPLVNPGDPLETIGLGTFFPPGTYISTYDVLESPRQYTLRISEAAANRIYSRLLPEDRIGMFEWLEFYGVSTEDIDIDDSRQLLEVWWEHYSEDKRLEGMIRADHLRFVRLDRKLDGLFDSYDFIIYTYNEELGEYEEGYTIVDTDYIRMSEIPNIVRLPLGTDNFGRDVLKLLVSAIGASMIMGLVAGTIATSIGLVLGLLAGYIGGLLDDILQFVNNILTVIPGFIVLVLLSYAIGQENRSVMTVAVVIGLTAWVWTARSVRSQVLSLRNRDHVNLSKLSGHSMVRIILKDILPYIASYVVMAFILQLSSAILAEAGLSMLGLGPRTTDQFTLGLMMQWGMIFGAHINGAWWAYFPVIGIIAVISFSLNLMNTGLDQVFNPQLRD
jgi:peptide/nickel transport system permease protein